MIEACAGGVRLHLYVQPNGKKSEILGVHDGALKIRVQAPPVEGQANEAVTAFIAQVLGVPRKKVSLIRGAQSRQKTVEIDGITLEEMHIALERAMVPGA